MAQGALHDNVHRQMKWYFRFREEMKKSPTANNSITISHMHLKKVKFIFTSSMCLYPCWRFFVFFYKVNLKFYYFYSTNLFHSHNIAKAFFPQAHLKDSNNMRQESLGVTMCIVQSISLSTSVVVCPAAGSDCTTLFCIAVVEDLQMPD